jgi:3-deoxy-D-manno-octulosonic acid kinase
MDAGGRGVVYRFQSGEGEGIVRVYRRGGAIRHVLKETYLFDNRPRKEFSVHYYALQHGLPVPPLLGVVWRQTGPAFRGRIATGYIHAEHLQRWLEATCAPDTNRLHEVGASIRRMHDVGISHADLQVRNILMAQDHAYLIDFDRAVVHPQLADKYKLRNLIRLRRSFVKNSVPLKTFHAICAGYGAERFPGWMEQLSRGRENPSP